MDISRNLTLVERYLEVQKEVFDQAKEILRDRLLPAPDPVSEMTYVNDAPLDFVAEYLVLRGQDSLIHQQWEPLLSDARLLMELADKSSASDLPASHQIAMRGLFLFAKLLNDQKSPHSVLTTALGIIPESGKALSPLPEVLNYEYAKFRTAVIDRGVSSHGFFNNPAVFATSEGWRFLLTYIEILPHRTASLMAGDLRATEKLLALPYSQLAKHFSLIDSRELRFCQEKMRNGWSVLFQRNGGGVALEQSRFLGVLENVQTAFQIEAVTQVVRTALAARLYWDDTGNLPVTLANLAPKYLPVLPRDPFDGQPLRYSLQQRAVYSVSINFWDDLFPSPYEDVFRWRYGMNNILQPMLELSFAPPVPPNSSKK